MRIASIKTLYTSFLVFIFLFTFSAVDFSPASSPLHLAQVYAETPPACSVLFPGSTVTGMSRTLSAGATSHAVSVRITHPSFNTSASYKLAVFDTDTGGGPLNTQLDISGLLPGATQPLAYTISAPDALTKGGAANTDDKHWVTLMDSSGGAVCNLGWYRVTSTSGVGGCSGIVVSQTRAQTCYGGCFDTSASIKLEAMGLRDGSGLFNGGVKFVISSSTSGNIPDVRATATNGAATATVPMQASYGNKSWRIKVVKDTVGSPDFQGCVASLNLIATPPGCANTPEACITERPDPVGDSVDYKICDQIAPSLTTATGANMKDTCITCVGGSDEGQEGIWTAVGCIPKDPETIISVIVRLGLGMGGGFALLNILAAGFLLTVSQGNPKQTDDAKQRLTAALTGLLFIIFSVVLLHFIGYTVFKIPGFGE